ncbi:MAG: malonate-semialdehyde dehydrogenase (acetylating)/methylmalonate-semialdehyde dehydrogenase [Phycisphaerales bacterium]|jgi:malonate-semialdehyde dehydrogenase (acetylating)/methylmalonate-semialdehyde dehydrogenase
MSRPVAVHHIGGESVTDPATGETFTISNPATGEPMGIVPMSSTDMADRAVAAASKAFETWSEVPVGDRVQCLFRYKQILENNLSDIADIVVEEHGKTKAEAVGSLRRGIDCIEFACGAPVMMMGRTLPQIAVSTSFCRTADEGGVGIDSQIDQLPVGVCVGITPFNFPVMVPMWMWPIAVACGNTFVLKPSERDPFSTMREIELTKDAGFPAGVINLVHGGPDVSNRLITHPDVKAVSFVGSTTVGEHIYKTASAAGKRVQCMCGAKNHSIIMPDANQGAAVDGITGSAFGNTGQRCLAGSVVVCVGDSGDWLVPALVEKAKAIKVGPGDQKGVGMGPLVSKEAQERVLKYIAAGVSDGATLALDGRECDMPSTGCFVGPTIFDNCAPSMSIVSEEIFGPVLSIIRVDSLEDAIAAVNKSEFGNMSVIFTDSGHAVRRFQRTVQAGMLGVNVGVPAPMAAFPFAGWKRSFFGDLHANGEDAVRFNTKSRVMVTRWL